MPIKKYVILDSAPKAVGNSDFILLGLKSEGFARGCPMLFGGTADAKDGPVDGKNFALNLIKRETWEETNQNIGVKQVVRYQVYPNDISVYTSKDFTFTGKVAIGGEFAWIRKVSKGKIKTYFKNKPTATKDMFTQELYAMTLDVDIEPTDAEFEQYLSSDCLSAIYAYCKETCK
ncbi:hypothetical protein V6301_04915 [Serratia marcescens]|jgi:hypothetical protein|uniref:hypothetical protein n=1 Tax=Serratia TaxID=613 RepID=UPI000537A67F|nr:MULTISPECIES: hypothetical protein [Serratia]MBN5224739.1 hypothetical protein [Serratia ureilytica]PNO40953.1 hypothetical protein MC48_021150 [Serratia marcescens]